MLVRDLLRRPTRLHWVSPWHAHWLHLFHAAPGVEDGPGVGSGVGLGVCWSTSGGGLGSGGGSGGSGGAGTGHGWFAPVHASGVSYIIPAQGLSLCRVRNPVPHPKLNVSAEQSAHFRQFPLS